MRRRGRPGARGAAHRQNQRLPCGRLASDHPRGCTKLPHRRRAAGTTAHPPPIARRVAGGASSSWLGAALRVQASRLWDRRLSLPPPPLALITGVQAAARRARKGRAGASGAPAHACAGSAAEAWGWLVGLAVVAWAGECSQRGKLHEMASRSFHCDRLLPLPPPARPKPGSSLYALAHPPNSAAGLSDHGSAR